MPVPWPAAGVGLLAGSDRAAAAPPPVAAVADPADPRGEAPPADAVLAEESGAIADVVVSSVTYGVLPAATSWQMCGEAAPIRAPASLATYSDHPTAQAPAGHCSRGRASPAGPRGFWVVAQVLNRRAVNGPPVQ